jgi:capsular polysaccharide transport system permease protein
VSEIPIPAALPTARRQSLFWRHLRTTLALVLREMTTRYGANPGGYLWALLEPVGMILFLSLGFALLLRAPPLGTEFILFYATGYLPFTLFQKNAKFVMNALSFSRALLRYPAVTWLDAVLARAMLNTLTEVLVAALVLSGILMMLDSYVALRFGPIVLGFGLAALLGLGGGLINCCLVGFFPVWQTVWGILTRPLFLASAIFWLLRDLPQGAQSILYWNPLVHIAGLVRQGFYPTYDPHYVSVLFVLGLGMGLTALGLLLLRRYHLQILARG